MKKDFVERLNQCIQDRLDALDAALALETLPSCVGILAGRKVELQWLQEFIGGETN